MVNNHLMRVWGNIARLWVATILLSLSCAAGAQNAEYPHDYFSAHPELLNALPSPAQINAEVPGETEEERDAWRAAIYVELLWALKELLGPREFQPGAWRPAEREAISRYEQALQEILSNYEPGYWQRKRMEFGGGRERSIYERYLPVYLPWSEAQGRPIGPDTRISSFAEDAEAQQRYIITSVILFGLIAASLILLYVATREPGKRVRISIWVAIAVLWILAAAIGNALQEDDSESFSFGFQVVAILVIVALLVRTVPRNGRALQKKRAEAFLQACTGLPDEAFREAGRKERREAIQSEAHNLTGSVEFVAGFHMGQKDVGMVDAPLPVALKHFSIQRARSAMSDNWFFLAGAALLYNEGKSTAKAFEIQALSLVYEDGVGQLRTWKGCDSGKVQGLSSAHDVFRYIMTQRYRTSQAVREDLRVKLYKLHEEQAANGREEDEVVRSAGALFGLSR